jgi:hypothetical protein
MPAITDTYNSIGLVGWYGSAYLLAFGMSYSTFARLYPMFCKRFDGKGFLLPLLSCMIYFGVGAIFCYAIRDGRYILAGRVISGVGAAGSISGITFLNDVLYTKRKYRMNAFLLSQYALWRFVGPM